MGRTWSFVTAGEGGGQTGTGAAPVIAEVPITRSARINRRVVTRSVRFEGSMLAYAARRATASIACASMSTTLIVLPTRIC